MGAKALWLTAVCLVFLARIDGSFIKGKNVPRVGRSNEADGFYDHEMGYVIKTIPSKNIPRMGRRNYDSENRYDIPKLYGLPMEVQEEMPEYGQSSYPRYNEERLEELLT